ncbi:MAG: phage regulatory protein/antirepressor Ant [Gammaproteobacteria bacterium]|nr:phage regulatory protein/antirepressor Ant [Gammaproteobacteria bacterium]
MRDLTVTTAASMSSREIADLVESRHDNVRVTIERLASRAVIALPAMQEKATAGRPAKEYIFSGEQGKRDSIIVVAQLSPEFTARLVDRWQELESRQHVAIPQTYAEALLEAGRLAKIAEEQAAQLAIAAPKAEFVDKYVESTGLKGFRQVAKLLKANEARFREFLVDRKIMYRLGGEWHAYQNHIDAGRFDVKTGSSDSGHAFNQTKFTPKGVNWIAGLWAQHNLQGAA